MKEINELKELEKEIKQLKITEKAGYKAKVVSVEQIDSNVYFNTDEYENREGYKITFELLDDDEKTQWDEFFNHPTKQGLMGKKSKIGNFIRLYESYPKPELIVNAEVNDDGFFRCVVDV